MTGAELALVAQIVSLLIEYGPRALDDVMKLVADWKVALKGTPTDADWAALDARAKLARARLQATV